MIGDIGMHKVPPSRHKGRGQGRIGTTQPIDARSHEDKGRAQSLVDRAFVLELPAKETRLNVCISRRWEYPHKDGMKGFREECKSDLIKWVVCQYLADMTFFFFFLIFRSDSSGALTLSGSNGCMMSGKPRALAAL